MHSSDMSLAVFLGKIFQLTLDVVFCYYTNGRFNAMDTPLCFAGIFLAILVGYGLLRLYRRVFKRVEREDVDIQPFLRSEGAGSDIPCDIEFDHTINIHPWGKRQ